MHCAIWLFCCMFLFLVHIRSICPIVTSMNQIIPRNFLFLILSKFIEALLKGNQQKIAVSYLTIVWYIWFGSDLIYNLGYKTTNGNLTFQELQSFFHWFKFVVALPRGVLTIKYHESNPYADQHPWFIIPKNKTSTKYWHEV